MKFVSVVVGGFDQAGKSGPSGMEQKTLDKHGKTRYIITNWISQLFLKSKGERSKGENSVCAPHLTRSWISAKIVLTESVQYTTA